MRRLLAAALCLLVFAGAHAVEKSTPADDPAIIEGLREYHADLSKPHEMEFFLSLPDNEAVERVRPKVEALGFKCNSYNARDFKSIVLRAVKVMVPSVEEFARLRQLFTEMANAEGGEYGGLSTTPVR